MRQVRGFGTASPLECTRIARMCLLTLCGPALACTLLLTPTLARADLVSWWDFEGDLLDDTGGHAGTGYGGVATGLDKGRTALMLDGTDDLMTVPSGTSSSLDMTTNDFTVSVWVRWDGGVSDRDFLFSHARTLAPHNGYSMELRTGNSAYAARLTLDGGDTAAFPGTDDSVADSDWHHLAVVVSGNTFIDGRATFYLDGVVAGPAGHALIDPVVDISGSNLGSVSTSVESPPAVFKIGSNWNETSNFLGSLDDLAIWKDALPASSIAGLASGAFTPDTAPLFKGLKLDVNRETGAMQIVNRDEGDVSINYYRVEGDVDSLDPAEWNSLDEQDYDSVGAGTGESWDESGGSGTNQLSEAFLASSSTLTIGQSVSLGEGYDEAQDKQGLLFRYRDAVSGLMETGKVNYITLGDMDGDGDVDDADVNPFVQALTNRSAYDANLYEVDADFVGDFNDNGKLDLGDVAMFKTAVQAAGLATASATPEPSSLMMIVLAMACLCGRRVGMKYPGS